MEPLEPRGAPTSLGVILTGTDDQFRLLVESIRDYAIFLLDVNGHVLTWNKGAARIKGYTADEIIGKHFSVFYPQEAIDRGWPDCELKVAAQEGRCEDESWRRRKDGTLFWANVVITALHDPSGALVGFAKVTRDLSERREYEEHLRESEERFRLLVDGVHDYAICMLDRSGHVMSWNKGAERAMGYTAVEIIGQHFSRFFPPADIAEQRPERELRDARRLGGIEQEGWRLRKDGSRFWANIIVTAIYDSKGEHRGYAKVTRDLTQRRQIEELEESNRRINEFLAMLAHELRNPLAPIRNAVSVMQRSKMEDPTATWARDVIDRQTLQMTRLVDDLLDISRITSGKITLRCQPVDVEEIVNRAVEAARPLIDARRHELTVNLAHERLMLDGDTARLSQVLVNLLNNAAKYTPEGGHVSLSVVHEHDDVAIVVRDDGIGIPQTLQAKIFDLFAQGDRSLARSEGGLGIGLTLARRLVEMHGGTISVKSDGPNQGSEFAIRLPLLPTRTTAKEESAGTRVAADVRRVLVVDDNEDSAQTMAMLLTLAGHTARMAHDGRSAIAVAEEFRPHVVLLDIGLPEMDGYEVALRLRTMPAMRSAVFVAMTGYGQEDDRRRSLEAGFAHHLVKPIDPAALERVIASAACEG